ncbi:hypothetical protein, partial [Blautia sp. NSJ-165]|uniref:hypothetical protein n=1 Tax=Blautia sp. NSJ-165 TaxID=2931881 RepID=UPI001FD2A209
AALSVHIRPLEGNISPNPRSCTILACLECFPAPGPAPLLPDFGCGWSKKTAGVQLVGWTLQF